MNSTAFTLYARKEECCGCSACFAVCPQNAIEMRPDNEGFEYPNVNYDLCVQCYMCVKVCPVRGNDATQPQAILEQ